MARKRRATKTPAKRMARKKSDSDQNSTGVSDENELNENTQQDSGSNKPDFIIDKHDSNNSDQPDFIIEKQDSNSDIEDSNTEDNQNSSSSYAANERSHKHLGKFHYLERRHSSSQDEDCEFNTNDLMPQEIQDIVLGDMKGVIISQDDIANDTCMQGDIEHEEVVIEEIIDCEIVECEILETNEIEMGSEGNVAQSNSVDPKVPETVSDLVGNFEQSIHISEHSKQDVYDVDNSPVNQIKEIANSSCVVDIANSSSLKEIANSTIVKEYDNSTSVKENYSPPISKAIDNSTIFKDIDNSPIGKDIDYSPIVKDIDYSSSVKDYDTSTSVTEDYYSPCVKEDDNSTSVKEDYYSPRDKENDNSTSVKENYYSPRRDSENEISSNVKEKYYFARVSENDISSSVIENDNSLGFNENDNSLCLIENDNSISTKDNDYSSNIKENTSIQIHSDTEDSSCAKTTVNVDNVESSSVVSVSDESSVDKNIQEVKSETVRPKDTVASKKSEEKREPRRRSNRIKVNRWTDDDTNKTTTSHELTTPPPPPPSTLFDADKPVKVKSRWRRTSELEMGGTGGSVNSDSDHSSTTTVSVASEIPSVLEPEVEERLKSFDIITHNVFLTPRTWNKDTKKMVCDCTLSKEEIAKSEMGCGEDCLNRLLMIECGTRCSLGNLCSNKNYENCQYTKCQVIKTEKKGLGLIATTSVQAGTFIMEYVGEVLDPKEFRRRAKEYSKEKVPHFYFMALKGDTIIDATARGNISRFINHSCDPNTETQKWTVNGELRIGFFSKRTINKGEEITFDYQLQRYGKEAQRCYCGSSNCRGWIGEDPDKDKEREKKESGTKKERKEKKRKEEKRREIREFLSDVDLEEEIEKLSASGVKNQKHTLTLSRLMVRAEDSSSRHQLLEIAQAADTCCLRLFLDYHGLGLLWSWMVDSRSSSKLRLEILNTLTVLPITNKTILQDSKVLSAVEKWAKSEDTTGTTDSNEGKDRKEETDDSSPNEGVEKPETEGVEKTETVPQKISDEKDEDTEKSILAKAAELLGAWSGLKEEFRIPKKERLEQMKEHEREANRGYVDHRESQSYDSHWSYDKENRYSRGDRKRGRESPTEPDWRKQRLQDDRHNGTVSRLSKIERRQLFAMKVEEEERQRKIEESWVKHQQQQQMLGPRPPQMDQGYYQQPPFHPPPDGDMVFGGCPPVFPPFLGPPGHPPPPFLDGPPPPHPFPPPGPPGPGFHPAYPPHPSMPPLSPMPPNPMGLGAAPFPMGNPRGPMPPYSPFPNFNPVLQGPVPPPVYPPSPVMPVPAMPVPALPAPNTIPPVILAAAGPPPPPPPLPVPVIIRLPPKWRSAKDKEGRTYYYHTKTRKSQWQIPTEETAQQVSESESDSDESTDDDDTSSEEEDENKEEFEYDETFEEEESIKKEEEYIIDNPVAEETTKIDEIPTPILTPPVLKKRREGLVQVNIISPRDEDDDYRCGIKKKQIRETKEKLAKEKRKMLRKSGGAAKCEADTSISPRRRIKDLFRVQMANVVVAVLNSYRRSDCKIARITNTEDFKHLARKLTHFVMVKELKHCARVEELECNDNVKHKAKDFIRKYMSKFGPIYKRTSED